MVYREPCCKSCSATAARAPVCTSSCTAMLGTTERPASMRTKRLITSMELNSIVMRRRTRAWIQRSSMRRREMLRMADEDVVAGKEWDRLELGFETDQGHDTEIDLMGTHCLNRLGRC